MTQQVAERKNLVTRRLKGVLMIRGFKNSSGFKKMR
jgi:hypothetical protein